MAQVSDVSHLEWPFFEARHQRLASAFGRWAIDHFRDTEDNEGNDGIVARQLFEALGRDGWLRSTLPAEGAERPDLRSVCVLRELCAYASAIADVSLSEPWLGALPISLSGSAELKARYLPRYLAGTLLPAFALSEPDAGSDFAAIRTTYRIDDRGYVLNGRKTWTSNAGLADLYVVFARGEGGGRESISAFLVEPADGGTVLEERLAVMPPHTVGTWRLENCRISADRLLGRIGQGISIALSALELFRPTVGAAALGFARRGMGEALARSCARNAFNKPICEHQLIQSKLADMALKIDAAALLIYRAAWAHDGGHRIGREAAMAKLYATEAAHQVIDEAVQIFGGLGVVRGVAVERLYRHVRAFRIFDGTSEIQRLIIARDLIRHASGAEKPIDAKSGEGDHA